MGGDDLVVPPGTERLRLRRLTAADVDALVELDSDPEVMRFLTGGVATPRATVQDEQVPRLLAQYERHPGLGRWAALDRAGGDFLGWFALDPSEDGTEAELGYRLRRSTWGRGLATEGSRALVRYAFDTVGVRRVWAETMAVNERSRRVLAKAGLRHVRTFHLQFDDPIPGTEHGEVEYELRADVAQDRPAALRAR
ncbi:GNAT family N-acetyltransferase [Micromonospora lupini]|uniref:GNAT family N-acetyltransferase n=1 Tax=Micromonospora lupini TaxID=285679 RepID=UPI00225B1C99|nr:GNAT family N-acetyltransferase [Micromonospora lupini]MCX5067984.1 GNAT family N-acetyltransferase [Micromonospora lupini]